MKSFLRPCSLAVAFLCSASLLPAAATAPSAPVRVACVGDSITAGSGTTLAALDSYPSQLQRMLDPDKWLVGNFGVSGATLLNGGDKPYQKQALFQDALTFHPDIVIIMLGTNDTKPQNWRLKDRFTADYHDLVAKFKALPGPPRIFLCCAPVVPGTGNYGLNEAGVLEEIPLIAAIAKEEQAGEIDMHGSLLGHEALLLDRVHPNTDGANILARTVYRALTGQEFTGTLDPALRAVWHDYTRLNFASGGRVGSLMLPKTPAPGQPWIWRTEFLDTESQGDLALLAQGWHVAYVNVQNMFGSPASLDAMDTFYAQVVKTYALNPKVVLEGFSRGGLFAFNWAARHPDRVASIYADAPVLDFKSWPAGRGKGQGSKADWQNLLKAYHLTEAEALAYPLNPVDNLKPLAGAKIPLLIICGDADKTVPHDENALIAQSRYQALGGEVQLIVKPGGDHHPHSLPDPQPIVEFVLRHAP